MKKSKVIGMLILGLLICLAGFTKAQTVDVTSIVPTEVEVWGPPLEVDMGGTVCVFRIKVLKHYGTTCVYNVEIANKGDKTLTALMGILTHGGQVNDNTAGGITIKPGERFYWKREKREILKKGVKNDAQVCKNCNPIVGFYNLKVGGRSVK